MYSTNEPLLPLLVIRPVQNLSTCTLQLYLYSPYGQYGLHRASVPVRYSYTSTPPIGHTAHTEPQCMYSTNEPLLPLLVIRPVQNLSTCTLQLYLYYPYGPYGLHRASVPVRYSYTSTPPIGHTACTESQCLYSTAIILHPLLAIRPVQSLSACTIQIYFYSPYCPYGLSQHQCLCSTAIPLLPQLAIPPAQRLSACTIQLYLYSPYGPYKLHGAQVPVQYS